MQETGSPVGDEPKVTPLAQMRMVLITFSLGLVGCGAATVVVTGSDGSEDGLAPAVAAGAVVAAGVVGWLIPGLLGPRLDCTTATTLVGSYRARFFLRVAFAEMAALTGFVMALTTYEPWPYFLGLAFTAAGFVRAAPTAGNLARDQEHLAVAGCAHPLAQTLGAPGSPGTPGPASPLS